jgi:ParB/RepB/Spo0J family partition protein
MLVAIPLASKKFRRFLCNRTASNFRAEQNNLQRADLNATEEAAAFQQFMNHFGLTHEDVAQKVGKDRSQLRYVLFYVKHHLP